MENGEAAAGGGGAAGTSGTSHVEEAETTNPVEGAAGGGGQNAQTKKQPASKKDEMKQSNPAKPEKGAEGGAVGGKLEFLSEESKAKIQEASERALNAINKLRNTQEGLSEYQDQLKQWMAEQVILENRLLEAIEGTKRMRQRIMAEEDRVMALKENLEVMEPEDEGEGRQV